MKLDLQGTQSKKNLQEAFACESQSRNRYAYFAKQALLEGDEKVAELFDTMANNEFEHAKIWYKILNSGIGDISQNLEDAAKREHHEWYDVYPRFAQTAREEGFELLAIMFENIAAIEKNHEMIFLEMLAQRNSGEDSPQKTTDLYTCKHCGYISKQKPQTCPVCGEENCF